MAVTDGSSKLLERPHAMQVLMHLRKHFPMPLVQLPGNIKMNRSDLERRIHELAVAGMIRMHENPKQTLNVSLTPFGRDVANRNAKMTR
jgi:DNA-binding MarR family transcriptional regulator